MAKSSMNNLDSTSVSKIPYSVFYPNPGYSHSSQVFNILNKNLKNLLLFKKKRILFKYVKLKKYKNLTKKHIKIKPRVNFIRSFGTQQATLNFTKINNKNFIMFSILYVNPYIARDKGIDFLKKKITLGNIKSLYKMKKIFKYKQLLLINYTREFTNYNMELFIDDSTLLCNKTNPIYCTYNSDWVHSEGIHKQAERVAVIRYDYTFEFNENGILSTLSSVFDMYTELYPSGADIDGRMKFNLIFYKQTNPYKHFRMFMGFPANGQRTWSNGKIATKRVNIVKNWEIGRTEDQFQFKCPRVVITKLSHMEYLNEMWSSQWRHEWSSAKNYRGYFNTKWKYKDWKFDMDLVVTNKALTYYTDPIKLRPRPRKKKKNRKKQVLPKNKINIGFDEGFAEVYFKKIFHKTIWMKGRSVLL